MMTPNLGWEVGYPNLQILSHSLICFTLILQPRAHKGQASPSISVRGVVYSDRGNTKIEGAVVSCALRTGEWSKNGGRKAWENSASLALCLADIFSE